MQWRIRSRDQRQLCQRRPHHLHYCLSVDLGRNKTTVSTFLPAFLSRRSLHHYRNDDDGGDALRDLDRSSLNGNLASKTSRSTQHMFLNRPPKRLCSLYSYNRYCSRLFFLQSLRCSSGRSRYLLTRCKSHSRSLHLDSHRSCRLHFRHRSRNSCCMSRHCSMTAALGIHSIPDRSLMAALRSSHTGSHPTQGMHCCRC